ncbi:2-oxoacid dehydrogenases acyltransferase-domain-containing protein [Thamnocephalis sphaerospora]|uniref:Acetyltransferase component of pyruvate dehydrogenase complex n=1 Tax=Thamnocephalis sphaerospora TaxID=78915 RepID=A0A4P9XR11_9FUNG|nr:2-oxoacid dehydrogenases acyltransferase-domain-containing protein [Thamnocephalis sphaerospora]|eukprot:RKP08488.1 2-oxoacid dehydrogenases acyltransferase-domain-containing protein [Thamnocephalis sphaerospora]
MARVLYTPAYPNHIVINMPALSPTMTHGNIGTWRKQPGDEIVPGDVLVEIETDKAQMDFECQEEGFLAKILVESGSKDVDIRTPIAVLVENKDDIAQFADFTVEAAPSAIETKPESSAASEPESKTPEAPTKSESKSSSAASSAAQTSPAGRIKASPLAKTLAVEHGLSLKDVHGSGPNGRITKADVEKLIASGKPRCTGAGAASAAAPAATGPAAAAYTDIPLTNMRKTIAKRLTEAKQQLPHYYLTIEVQMDKINQLRQAFNQTSEGKYRLSVNDFVIKASAQALKDVPEVNSAWHGEQIRQYHSADICVATATPTGLITPIVANAGAKGLAEISNTVKELAGRARKNELKPHEYQGGTFTISNLGMFGIQSFTAIINPPQSCILAVGSSEKKVVPAPNGDGYATINVMKVTLSCDHRVVDGAVGAQWLQAWKRYMENPLSMML